ncbi:MAG TPA: OmpA family protein [Bryobacteraceae bacterium]|jgi:chemotaxis protein MotB
MARTKKAQKENHDRWLVSYADLVTLLFAFFVVMFASTQSDKSRAKAISAAVENALQNGGIPPQVLAILGGTKAATPAPKTGQERTVQEKPLPAHLIDLAAAYGALREKLDPEIKNGAVELHIEERGIIIGLNSAVFFPSGGDSIDKSVFSILDKVASVLNQLPNPLRLEGHTDSVPINTARFQSNWELSAARGIAMLRALDENYGVARSRMAVVGYADTQSLESNESEEGRRKNRRVDIVIVSAYGMRSEPKPSPAAPVQNSQVRNSAGVH